MKNVWFACHSSPIIGLGHLSRCIALAEEFMLRNIEVCFAHLSNIDVRGVVLLTQSDLSLTCSCTNRPDVIVIDSYELEFIERIKTSQKSKFLLLVDDVSPLVDVDFYIQASPIRIWRPRNKLAKVFNFEKNPILRRTYDSNQSWKVSKSLPFKVLISLGAAQNRTEILTILVSKLRQSSEFNPTISIIGLGHEDSELEALSQSLEITVLRGAPQFNSLVQEYSFVISGAGVTAWELISLGVPGFLVGVANNQYEQIRYLTDINFRSGLMYESDIQFQSQLDNLLLNTNFQSQIEISRGTIENGRELAVTWIIENY